MRPRVNHRLDSKNHTYTQREPPVTKPMVGNMRALMHIATNAMASIIAYNAEARPLGNTLNGMTNIT